jgi:hypothetical protein
LKLAPVEGSWNVPLYAPGRVFRDMMPSVLNLLTRSKQLKCTATTLTGSSGADMLKTAS